MKIIDEKGRLFGKINLIDLLVLVLVVAREVKIELQGEAGFKKSQRRAAPCRRVFRWPFS